VDREVTPTGRDRRLNAAAGGPMATTPAYFRTDRRGSGVEQRRLALASRILRQCLSPPAGRAGTDRHGGSRTRSRCADPRLKRGSDAGALARCSRASPRRRPLPLRADRGFKWSGCPISPFLLTPFPPPSPPFPPLPYLPSPLPSHPGVKLSVTPLPPVLHLPTILFCSHYPIFLFTHIYPDPRPLLY